MLNMIHNLDHLSELPNVVLNDLYTLSEKEQQYEGSWKRKGGVSAYMMLMRKWDRMQALIENHHGNDIFAALKADDREEGLLDDIGDLRRYLMLVEAEYRRYSGDGDVQVEGICKKLDVGKEVVFNEIKLLLKAITEDYRNEQAVKGVGMAKPAEDSQDALDEQTAMREARKHYVNQDPDIPNPQPTNPDGMHPVPEREQETLQGYPINPKSNGIESETADSRLRKEQLRTHLAEQEINTFIPKSKNDIPIHSLVADINSYYYDNMFHLVKKRSGHLLIVDGVDPHTGHSGRGVRTLHAASVVVLHNN